MTEHYVELYTDNGETKDMWSEITRADGTKKRLPPVDFRRPLKRPLGSITRNKLDRLLSELDEIDILIDVDASA